MTAPLKPNGVDLEHSTNLVEELHNALVKHGFVAIRNCGISGELLDNAFATSRAYFAQDRAKKLRDVYTDTQANFGYQGVESEALDPSIEADLKEAFTMRNLSNRTQATDNSEEVRPGVDPTTPWAETRFGATATALYQSCSAVSQHLLRLMAQALNAPAATFDPFHRGENMTLRYLHYPSVADSNALSTHQIGEQPGDKIKKKHQLGAGAHTDYGTITLLFSDGVAGLQLFDKSTGDTAGRWRDVEVAAGDVLVNTGDLMALWSNGAYPSTLHRVQPRVGKPERFSMAFFVDPDSNTRVSPLPSCIDSSAAPGSSAGSAHPTSAKVVVAGEHIQARIEASQRTLA